MKERKTDVHTSHCCIVHGCKYGNEDCTVESLIAKQEYFCEQCGLETEGYYGPPRRSPAQQQELLDLVWNQRMKAQNEGKELDEDEAYEVIQAYETLIEEREIVHKETLKWHQALEKYFPEIRERQLETPEILVEWLAQKMGWEKAL